MVRKAADVYIDENEGYYVIRTYTWKDLTPAMFETKEIYDKYITALKKADKTSITLVCFNSTPAYRGFYCFDGFSFVGGFSSGRKDLFNLYSYDNSSVWRPSGSIVNLCVNLPSTYLEYRYNFFTNDGRSLRIWKSLDSMKNHIVGKDNLYFSSGYGSFNESDDNSVTFTGAYYSNSSYSHTIIQNNIDNSQEINETVINNIVNNYITNNYYGTDSDSNDGGIGGDGSGNWLIDLIKGIPELLKALVDGLAGISDSIVGLFKKLFTPSEESRSSLKEKVEEKFSFVGISHGEITSLQDRFETMGNTAPTITFPLSKTPLSEYGVGDITVLFDWFEPYRYGFHTLLSSIMWIMFIFNQYFALKHIIQGTGSFTSSLEEPEPEHHRSGFDLW